MAHYYSPEKKGFFDTDHIPLKEIPADRIAITDEKRLELLDGQANIGPISFEGGKLFNKLPKLSEIKMSASHDLKITADRFVSSIVATEYPSFEVQTFRSQVIEAERCIANNGADTPLLDALCMNRYGAIKNRVELANKITEKSKKLELLSFKLAGQRQRYQDMISAANTPEEVENINFKFKA